MDRNSATAHAEAWNHAKAVNYQEFLQSLVLIAIYKFVIPGAILDIADAIEELLRMIASRSPPEALQNSNEFRRRFCYTEQMDNVLSKHMRSLRNIYDVYAGVVHDIHDGLEDNRWMSAAEWIRFCTDLGLVERFLPFRCAMQIFLWSRIRSRDDHQLGSEKRLRHLFFEDFMEALVRMAVMVPLPTDADIAYLGCVDGGDYLQQLLTQDAEAFDSFAQERSQDWTREPRQRASRCVDHLLLYVIRTMECSVSTSVGQDLEISIEEVRQFADRRSNGELEAAGARPVRRHLKTSRNESISISQSLLHVKTILFDALRTVEMFSSIPDDELKVLRDEMSHANFRKGEIIFEQGDIGHTFYVVLRGEAEALMLVSDDEGAGEEVAALVGAGAFFGELALLRNEPRAASLRARTDLKTMCVTRDKFEELLGPLHNYLEGHQWDRSGLETS